MTERTLPEDAVLIPNDATRMFQGVVFGVYQWQQEMFDGSHKTFEMLKRPDSVTVLAFDDQGRVITLDETQPHGKPRKRYLPVGVSMMTMRVCSRLHGVRWSRRPGMHLPSGGSTFEEVRQNNRHNGSLRILEQLETKEELFKYLEKA